MTDRTFLVVAYDRLGPRHAGPAVRTLALANELARIARVEIIFDGEVPEDTGERISFIPRESIEPSPEFFSRFRAALAPPLVAMVLPELLGTDLPLIIDLFDPVVWENLELYGNSPLAERNFQHERHLAALLAGLFRGDYFLVAGARQQDLFLGALMALNRLNPSTWQAESGPEQLVGLVPFGLPDESPPSGDEVLLPDEFISDGPLVVWGGGMWDWLKPEIVVRAWPDVLDKFPRARLVFPGTRHPNPHVPEMASVGRVKKLANDLGIIDTLNFGRWLSRSEYLGLLAHTDCGVSAHSSGLEARYAVRARFLDAIWMGVPLVVSGGDEYSDYIDENGLGVVVETPEPSDFATGILQVLKTGRDRYAGSFSQMRSELAWSRMAKPLVEWAKSPRSTHGAGADFFHESIGDASPRARPGDIGSLIRRLISKLRK